MENAENMEKEVLAGCGGAERIIVMGGSFDPVHCGHLAAAAAARNRLAPAAVLFVPAAVSPYKRSTGAPAAARLEMTALAAAGRRDFYVTGLEIERGAPSFTVDTLRLLRQYFPRPELWLAAGADVIADLPGWKEAAAIKSLARLVCVSRPGYAPAALPGWDIEIISAATPDVSSSMIRARVRAGAPLAGLTPAAVARYIEKERLYRA
ncbi:MAG: nicotinate-nucleotide adenylyltransferase [Gracilibacteraceae bacterium]|jgi:nicotinate-nucleotide adenylyltransferase|nr:nicotinate-nucleotide adenylyltransferase [Gracilibacteraceae bacterium]